MINAERARYAKVLNSTQTGKPYTNHVIRYFADVFLGNGHRGLAKIAENEGINVRDLSRGEFVMFVNKAQTGLKLFAPGNIVCYLKMPGNEKLNPRVMTLIPRFFNGTEINYNGALREAVKRYYPKKELQ